MSTFASIRNRPAWLTGRIRKGKSRSPWGIAAGPTPSAELVLFGFDVKSDGADGFHLVFCSMDGAYQADTWHETLADAYATAEESFGVRREEWGPPQE